MFQGPGQNEELKIVNLVVSSVWGGFLHTKQAKELLEISPHTIL
jgi:hypothetical protein